VRYMVDVIGTKPVSKNFLRMGDRVQDARPAFTKILAYIFDVEKRIFSSEGRRGGGSWRRLSPSWTERKSELYPGETRMGIASGVLYEALTQPDAPHQNIKLQRQQLIVGIALPYIVTQQENRPVIKFTKKDTEHMRGILSDHLMSVWRRRRRV